MQCSALKGNSRFNHDPQPTRPLKLTLASSLHHSIVHAIASHYLKSSSSMITVDKPPERAAAAVGLGRKNNTIPNYAWSDSLMFLTNIGKGIELGRTGFFICYA